jgi:hypothetical protein
LRYRFLAFDPADMTRVSAIKEWTAKLRLKYQLHNRGDHYEVELLALPKVGGIDIRYTTDGSSPTGAGHATYGGGFRVPANCRVVCGIAVASTYSLNSETLRITIPQAVAGERAIDPTRPALWNQPTKLDDAGAVWDLIGRLETAEYVLGFDISLTAESADGTQNVDYSGALEGGYNAAALHAVAGKLQEIVGGSRLRMTIGSFSFPTGQALLDWLRLVNQPFDINKVSQ